MKSAAITVEDGDDKVLCDPWLLDGAYYGSWCHDPPTKFEPEEYNDVDYIYISNIHPDHFHPPTLRRMDDDIPVLIHDYENDYLKDEIKRLGFDTEPSNGRSTRGGVTSMYRVPYDRRSGERPKSLAQVTPDPESTNSVEQRMAEDRSGAVRGKPSRQKG